MMPRHLPHHWKQSAGSAVVGSLVATAASGAVQMLLPAPRSLFQWGLSFLSHSTEGCPA